MNATVTIFHNVVWSRHKGAVLSALHNISGSGSIKYSMVQIADTEHDRIGFSDVDYSFHSYPMRKLYNGCYGVTLSSRWPDSKRLNTTSEHHG